MTPPQTHIFETEVVPALRDQESRIRRLEDMVSGVPTSLSEINSKLGFLQVLEERDKYYREIFVRLEKETSNMDAKFEELSRKVIGTIEGFKEKELSDVRAEFTRRLETTENALKSEIKTIKEESLAKEKEQKAINTKHGNIILIGTGIFICITGIASIFGKYFYLKMDQVLDATNKVIYSEKYAGKRVQIPTSLPEKDSIQP